MSLQGMESEPSAFLGTEPETTLVGRRAIGRKDDMHNASHDDHSRLGADDEQPEQAPHHALNGPGGAPSGPWKTWLDVPLVLRAPEVQLLLNVSRSTAYAAMSDGTIPSFRVRNTLRCLRIVVWAVANGADPQIYIGKYPFDDRDPSAIAS